MTSPSATVGTEYPSYPEGYWERAEGSNYRNYGDDPGWRVVLNTLEGVEALPQSPTVVEAACSKGWFIYHARQRGWDAMGFDISEYAISVAVARDYVVVHNAAEVWPYADATADAVFSFEFFEHVFESDTTKVLGEARRVLKPGGLLIQKLGIEVPSDHPFAGQDDHDETHVNIHAREWWETQFRDSGFSHGPIESAIQSALDEAFADRDWTGRWFVWQRP